MLARTEGLGGKMSATSDQNSGTTLTFTIPMGGRDESISEDENA
jgi:hypothetical protein